MTMKVSKGLEFSVVALPGVGHMPAAGEDEIDAAGVLCAGDAGDAKVSDWGGWAVSVRPALVMPSSFAEDVSVRHATRPCMPGKLRVALPNPIGIHLGSFEHGLIGDPIKEAHP